MASDAPASPDGPAEPGTGGILHESTKHGPGTDDRLVADGADRDGPFVESDLGTPSVPGEPATPEVRARPSPPDDVTEGPMERGVRSEIRRQLDDASYPATRNDLLRHLGPDERGPVHAHLRALPPDLVFSSVEEVTSAFGGIHSGE